MIPVRRNIEKTIDIRYKYARTFYELEEMFSDRNIFFIDEVGFQVSMRVTKGRSLIGSTPNIRVPNIRSRNISVCCAISKYCLKFKKISITPYNTKSFLGYIEEFFKFLDNQNINKCKYVLIMDNVAFHKNTNISEIIKRNEHKLVFLPPYSPFLNPIENAFSKWKNYVRRKCPNTEEELFLYMEEGFNTITADDCDGYFRNMKKYVRLCMNKTEIIP